MFEKLFGRLRKLGNAREYQALRMPEVDAVPDIEEVFAKARKAAAGDQPVEQKGRNVIVVSPGRLLMLTMSGPWVDGVEPSSLGRGDDLSRGQKEHCGNCLYRIERLKIGHLKDDTLLRNSSRFCLYRTCRADF